MQDSRNIEKAEAQRKTAMVWIGSLLETIANGLGVKIATWGWQIDSNTADTNAYHLVVTGARDRRTIKLFTSNELDRCLVDKELQSEIHARLTRLVSFIGDRADVDSANKTFRKRRDT